MNIYRVTFIQDTFLIQAPSPASAGLEAIRLMERKYGKDAVVSNYNISFIGVLDSIVIGKSI